MTTSVGGEMTTGTAGNDPFDAAARRLEHYRAHADSRGTEVITGVAGALRAGGGALTGTDLVSAYPPQSLLPDQPRLTWWIRVVELLRDGALFAPVAVTWLRLSDALNAYDRSHSQLPFLTAWQTGVGGTTTLSATAWDVARIVLLVIALTVLLHLLSGRLERRAELRDGLGRDLAHATWLVATYSPPERVDVSARTLNRVSAQIARSSDQLNEGMSTAATHIAQAVATSPESPLGAALGEWRRTAQQLYSVALTLKAPQDTLDEAIRLQQDLSREMRGLGDRMENLVRKLHESTETNAAQAHSHRAVSDEVAQATRQLGTALTELNSRAEVFGEIVDRLRYMVAALDAEGVRHWDGRPFDGGPFEPGPGVVAGER